jgi:hypothetical protein
MLHLLASSQLGFMDGAGAGFPGSLAVKPEAELGIAALQTCSQQLPGGIVGTILSSHRNLTSK